MEIYIGFIYTYISIIYLDSYSLDRDSLEESYSSFRFFSESLNLGGEEVDRRRGAIIILANKQDLPNAMAIDEIAEYVV